MLTFNPKASINQFASQAKIGKDKEDRLLNILSSLGWRQMLTRFSPCSSSLKIQRATIPEKGLSPSGNLGFRIFPEH